MRIVFDITTPQVACGGGKPYSNLPGWMGFSSAQVDVMIAEDCAENHPDLSPRMFGHDDMPIHIEGDSKYIIPVLKDLLRVLENTENHMRERLGELRPTNCPDGCEDIERFNGNHSIECPRHPNHEILKSRS